MGLQSFVHLECRQRTRQPSAAVVVVVVVMGLGITEKNCDINPCQPQQAVYFSSSTKQVNTNEAYERILLFL